MEGLQDCLEALVLLIFPLGQPVGADTPQPPPNSGVQSPSSPQVVETNGDHLNIIDPSEARNSSSPPPTHSNGPNLTTPKNRPPSTSPPFLPTKDHGSEARASSSSPSEAHGSPPIGGACGSSSSPHTEVRGGRLNIIEPIGEAHSSSLSPPTEPHGNPTTKTGANFFHAAHDFVLKNSSIIVQNLQGYRETVTQGMKALFEHVIEGVEYDSSLRDPPPQCHPGTRVQLREKVLAWCYNNGREKALLWLNGPAGVGKSAIIQTVAESLAESNSIGSTLFFSRLNDRKDPQKVFITVASQLATRIPSYQIYITERIARDPSLLKKGMKEQFRILVTEPFGKKGIGKGEGPWAVLLDGLDECEGVDEQCRIVQIISEFVLAFPHAPLVWAIASRPEPHITTTFNNERVSSSCWREYVPIDSTQACRDVEHYLDARFKAMGEQYPHLPPSWPSETQFLKLSNGALGLFVFARTAVRFMEDPNHGDPVSRLTLLLSIIDRLDIKVIDDHPFALLDALYTQIVTSIPPSAWYTAKRILGTTIVTQSSDTESGLSYPKLASRTFLGVSIILGIELNVAYSSLHKLHSVLNIPDSNKADGSTVAFLHASFGDYLTDRARSKDFYIDRKESVDEITRCLFQLYLDRPWDTKWAQYTYKPLSTLSRFLVSDAKKNLRYVLSGELRSMRGRGPFKSQQDRSECLDALRQINPVEAYKDEGIGGETIRFLVNLFYTFQEELLSTGLFDEVLLPYLKEDNPPRFKAAFFERKHGMTTGWVGRIPFFT